LSEPEKIKVDYKKLKAQGKKILDRVNEVRQQSLEAGDPAALPNGGWSMPVRLTIVNDEFGAEFSRRVFEDGTPATIEIYKRDIKGPDVVFETIEAKVKGYKIDAEWEYVYPEDEDEEEEGDEDE